jgi:hypothetical protein
MLYFFQNMCIFLGVFLVFLFENLHMVIHQHCGKTCYYILVLNNQFFNLHYQNHLAVKLTGEHDTFKMKFIKAYNHIGFYDNFIHGSHYPAIYVVFCFIIMLQVR